MNLHELTQCLERPLLEALIVSSVINNEKAIVGAFTGYCETSRRFVDSSTGYPVQTAQT